MIQIIQVQIIKEITYPLNKITNKIKKLFIKLC